MLSAITAKKTLTAHSSAGTGHLIRHIKSCKLRKLGSNAMSQSLLRVNPDGSVHHWEYSPEVARTQLCRLIAREDLLVCFGESAAFEEYIKLAHNPRFVPVSRQTTTRDFVKYFNERRSKLLETLKSVSSVALTSDIWSGNAKEDYLSIVAHYVNSDWQLEKRILGLRLIDVSHNHENIAECVLTCIDEYGLTDKVFSITLDNISANTKSMEILSPALSGYVGELFLHQRCACHIINLIVKAGLEVFEPMLARDVLTVHVSTISSESAFSLTSRIIEERRRRLTSDMVEMLSLVKDWEQADTKTQHTMENVELVEAFENLYLDDENV